MKSLSKIFCVATCVLLLITAAHAQTIRIADNNTIRPTGTNIYSTLQAAINAAQPDDIVYITPSNTSYGDVTLAKRIILQGVGFNTGLGDRTSTVGTIALTSSTDGINSCSGSVLREFYATTITLTDGTGSPSLNDIIIEKVIVASSINTSGLSSGYMSKAISNLIVRNSRINALGFYIANGMSNCKIYNNMIGSVSLFSFSTSGSGILNNTFSNNLFIYGSVNDPNINLTTGGAVNNTLILNNIFSGGSSTFIQLEGATISNNIFYGMTPTTNNGTNIFRNNNFSSNLVTNTITMPPAANGGGTNSGLGNLVGVSPNFVSVSGTSWLATYDYTLSTGSPAKNAGSDGTDIGPTGGAYPINKNIVFAPASLPLITELNTSGVVPQNQPIKANLKAKSN